MVNASINPLRLRRNARDARAAHRAGARRHRPCLRRRRGLERAHRGRRRSPCWLVTSLPDVPSYSGMRGRYAGALAQGDRVIAPSNYSAAPIMERYGLRAEQITIVPRVDRHRRPTIPPRCRRERVARAARALARRAGRPRRAWCPGASRRGTARSLLPEVARMLVDSGMRGFVFVIVGENTTHAKYARDVLKRAQAHGRRRPDPDGRALPRHAGRVRRRRLRRGSGDRGAAARPRRRAGAGDGTAGRDHRHRHACRSISWRRRECRRTCGPAGSRRPAIRPISRRR